MGLLYVHGRAKGQYSEKQINSKLLEALRTGAERANRKFDINRIAEISIVPYYAQLLDEYAERDFESSGSDAFAREFKAIVVEKALVEGSPPSYEDSIEFASSNKNPEDEYRNPLANRWVRAVARIADTLNPKLAASAIDWILRDVGTYLTSSQARGAVDAVVGDAIRKTSRPRVVVGHSLGSVVAYAIMHASPDLPVDHFVTVGSPLGVECVLSRLSHRSWPHGLDRWTNASDCRDIVALSPSLDRRSLFVGRGSMQHVRFDVTNFTDIDNHTDNRHGIEGYLQDPLVATAILRNIGEDTT